MPGCGIYSGIRGVESFVGRLEPVAAAPASQRLECPVQLKRTADNEIHATASSGQKRIGKPTDVKPGLHWLLVPREKGGYHLQPVNGWYDFPKPIAGLAAPAISCARPLVTSSGEAELRRDATQRRELADRWAGMLERRAARTGVKVKSGKAMDQLVPDEGDAVLQTKTDKVFLPDDERLNDEMGLRKQQKKKTKALKKEAGALNDAEDQEEVPETANALLKLKREKGEAGWDVDDDELFSDDEQEPCEFDGNLDNPDPQEVEAGLSADEEDADDDEKDLLTSHGRQLETLLENADEQFDNLRGNEQVDSASDDDGEQIDCKDDRPTKKQKIEASSSSTAPAPAMQSKSSSSAAVPLAVNADQARTGLLEAEVQHRAQSEDPWKQKAIDFLMQKGGKCLLKDMSRVLNLKQLKKSTETEEYQRVVEMLKEVSTVVNQTELVLNEQYREHQDEKKGLTPSSSPPRPEPSPSPPTDSGRPTKSKSKEKVVAPGERQDRFESMVSNFVSALHKKGFKSRLQAAEYLEGKTQGVKGLTESEVSEILRRFCRECNLKQ